MTSFFRSKKLQRKTSLRIVLLVILFSGCQSQQNEDPVTLKQAFNKHFLVGVAMNKAQITGADTVGALIIAQQFNCISPENCMKSEVVQPKEGQFDFTLADQYVDFGLRNNMFIIGHTLIWHSQAPRWFFTDNNGDTVSREVMIERMRTHIHTVVGRYKGKVNGWDVVNEAINDDGTYRQSPFYKIIGKDFIKLAFQFAHETDPDAELYYNDYAMAKEGRRNTIVQMVKELQAEGICISGIGMQGHLRLESPNLADFEKSIEAFSALGVKIMITEMDISVLPSPSISDGADINFNAKYDTVLNPYVNGLPDSIEIAFTERYAEFMSLFIEHSQSISRVTIWGLADKDSWRNYWPVRGRTDYPLLFDRQNHPKPVVDTLIKLAQANTTKDN